MNKKCSVYDIIKIIFYIIMIITSWMLGYVFNKIGIIPNKYLLLLYGIIIAVNLLVGILLLTRNKVLNVISFIIIIIFCPVMMIGKNYVNKTMNIFQNIINNNEERTSYYILSRNGEIDNIESLDGKNIGILTAESNYVKDNIKSDYVYKTYDIIGDLFYGLSNYEVDGIVVNASLYEYLKEINNGYTFNLNKVSSFEIKGKAEAITSNIEINKPFLLYISGVDSRDNYNISSYGLSEVNIVLAINPIKHQILLVQFPSNYFVTLDGMNKKDKLTHTGLYGIEMSLKTVSKLIGKDINTYVKVDFNVIKTIVDAIDGIYLNSEIEFNSYHLSNCTFKKGSNFVNGEQALAYARERFAYIGIEDIGGENPQQVITAIIDRIEGKRDYLDNYEKILDDCQKYLTTNFNLEDIQNFIKKQVDSGARWNFESYKVGGLDSRDFTASLPNDFTYVILPNNDLEIAKNKINNIMGD